MHCLQDEDGNAQFDDEEDWEEEEDDEEEEDEEEDLDAADAMDAGGMLDEMLEWDMAGPQFGRAGFGGAGMQTPTQVGGRAPSQDFNMSSHVHWAAHSVFFVLVTHEEHFGGARTNMGRLPLEVKSPDRLDMSA